ncbi:MAG: plastocyanin/azurin family copper-binding protein [Gemmatimonadaceae bacterium]
MLLALVFVAFGSAYGATKGHRQKGHVVTITMERDSTRAYFRPASVDVSVGDTLRFVDDAGRHNIDFLPDSNPRNVRLPAATGYVEHSGETILIPMTLPPGNYFFQCDPHAAMGMVGKVTVRSRTHSRKRTK